MQTHTTVLIVGAGPVGLTLALDLQRQQIPFLLIDAAPHPATTSRALGLHARTIELLSEFGVGADLAAQAQPVHAFSVYERGQCLTRFTLDLTGLGTPVQSSLFLGQADTEALLRQHLFAHGGTVWFGWRFLGVEQTAAGIVATLQGPEGQTQRVAASWLVGCDGGHSAVRKTLQIPFAGQPDETWLVVDAQVDWDLSTTSIHMLRTAAGTVVAFPFPQEGKWRLLDTQAPEGLIPEEQAQRFARLLSDTLDQSVSVASPTWSSRFTIQQRTVPTMQVGRCFLAGDAAHVHSPASGQGLNTGVQDALNLGWKLALVAKGQATEALLATYSAERLPVAHALLHSAQMSTRLLQPRQPWLRQIGGVALKRLNQVPALRQRVSRRIARGLSALETHYRDSALSHDIGATSAIRAGTRFPLLCGGVDVRPLRNPMRFTVFALPGLVPDQVTDQPLRQIREICAEEAEVHNLDHFGPAVYAALGIEDAMVYVIRPDGYIAYRGPFANPDALERWWRTWHLPASTSKKSEYVEPHMADR